jgi:head-tail adaptor
MIHKVDVERKTVTQDASGGKVDSWTARVRGMPCRVEPLSSDKIINFDKLGMQVTHVIYSNVFQGITDLDRLKFVDASGQTRYFEVRGCKDVDEWRRLTQIWAKELPT